MNAPPLQVSSEGGRIEIAGRLDLTSFRRLLATIHQTVADQGFGEVTLDFSDTTRAYPGPMLAVLASCVRLHDESDVEFFLVRPNDRKLRRLFSNANWAHIVSPDRFAPSGWQPTSVMPARWFTSPDEQHQIVDRIIDAVLSSPAELTRSSLAAFEWAVNEITDNVLQHAGSPQGGLVQLNHYPSVHWLEFAVADAGKGIPDTIGTTRTPRRCGTHWTCGVAGAIQRETMSNSGMNTRRRTVSISSSNRKPARSDPGRLAGQPE